MNPRMASNVEFATAAPVREFAATGYAELEAANVRRVAESLGVPRSALIGSRESAAEVLKARFKPDEVRELEKRST